MAADLIPTRQSLLSRLKDCEDHVSWQDFFNTYWRLIYNSARKAGLSDVEAQDVVQETIISVFKQMPTFQYDRAKGSFKGWLSKLAHWRIVDQFRKRQREIAIAELSAGDSAEALCVESFEDPTAFKLEKIWDEEWENNLIEVAAERVKRRVDSKHFQVFDLYVIKKWSVFKVAKAMSMNVGAVYLIKHRVGSLLRKEILNLQQNPM